MRRSQDFSSPEAGGRRHCVLQQYSRRNLLTCFTLWGVLSARCAGVYAQICGAADIQAVQVQVPTVSTYTAASTLVNIPSTLTWPDNGNGNITFTLNVSGTITSLAINVRNFRHDYAADVRMRVTLDGLSPWVTVLEQPCWNFQFGTIDAGGHTNPRVSIETLPGIDYTFGDTGLYGDSSSWCGGSGFTNALHPVLIPNGNVIPSFQSFAPLYKALNGTATVTVDLQDLLRLDYGVFDSIDLLIGVDGVLNTYEMDQQVMFTQLPTIGHLAEIGSLAPISSINTPFSGASYYYVADPLSSTGTSISFSYKVIIGCIPAWVASATFDLIDAPLVVSWNSPASKLLVDTVLSPAADVHVTPSFPSGSGIACIPSTIIISPGENAATCTVSGGTPGATYSIVYALEGPGDAPYVLNTDAADSIRLPFADTVRPSARITGPSCLQNGPFQIRVTFDEDVDGFDGDGSELVVSGGASGSITRVNASVYTANISPAEEGMVTVALSSSASIEDLSGNAMGSSTSFSVEYASCEDRSLNGVRILVLIDLTGISDDIAFLETFAAAVPSDEMLADVQACGFYQTSRLFLAGVSAVSGKAAVALYVGGYTSSTLVLSSFFECVATHLNVDAAIFSSSSLLDTLILDYSSANLPPSSGMVLSVKGAGVSNLIFGGSYVDVDLTAIRIPFTFGDGPASENLTDSDISSQESDQIAPTPTCTQTGITLCDELVGAGTNLIFSSDKQSDSANCSHASSVLSDSPDPDSTFRIEIDSASNSVFGVPIWILIVVGAFLLGVLWSLCCVYFLVLKPEEEEESIRMSNKLQLAGLPENSGTPFKANMILPSPRVTAGGPDEEDIKLLDISALQVLLEQAHMDAQGAISLSDGLQERDTLGKFSTLVQENLDFQGEELVGREITHERDHDADINDQDVNYRYSAADERMTALKFEIDRLQTEAGIAFECLERAVSSMADLEEAERGNIPNAGDIKVRVYSDLRECSRHAHFAEAVKLSAERHESMLHAEEVDSGNKNSLKTPISQQNIAGMNRSVSGDESGRTELSFGIDDYALARGNGAHSTAGEGFFIESSLLVRDIEELTRECDEHLSAIENLSAAALHNCNETIRNTSDIRRFGKENLSKADMSGDQNGEELLEIIVRIEQESSAIELILRNIQEMEAAAKKCAEESKSASADIIDSGKSMESVDVMSAYASIQIVAKSLGACKAIFDDVKTLTGAMEPRLANLRTLAILGATAIDIDQSLRSEKDRKRESHVDASSPESAVGNLNSAPVDEGVASAIAERDAALLELKAALEELDRLRRSSGQEDSSVDGARTIAERDAALLELKMALEELDKLRRAGGQADSSEDGARADRAIAERDAARLELQSALAEAERLRSVAGLLDVESHDSSVSPLNDFTLSASKITRPEAQRSVQLLLSFLDKARDDAAASYLCSVAAKDITERIPRQADVVAIAEKSMCLESYSLAEVESDKAQSTLMQLERALEDYISCQLSVEEYLTDGEVPVDLNTAQREAFVSSEDKRAIILATSIEEDALAISTHRIDCKFYLDNVGSAERQIYELCKDAIAEDEASGQSIVYHCQYDLLESIEKSAKDTSEIISETEPIINDAKANSAASNHEMDRARAAFALLPVQAREEASFETKMCLLALRANENVVKADTSINDASEDSIREALAAGEEMEVQLKPFADALKEAKAAVGNSSKSEVENFANVCKECVDGAKESFIVSFRAKMDLSNCQGRLRMSLPRMSRNADDAELWAQRALQRLALHPEEKRDIFQSFCRGVGLGKQAEKYFDEMKTENEGFIEHTSVLKLAYILHKSASPWDLLHFDIFTGLSEMEAAPGMRGYLDIEKLKEIVMRCQFANVDLEKLAASSSTFLADRVQSKENVKLLDSAIELDMNSGNHSNFIAASTKILDVYKGDDDNDTLFEEELRVLLRRILPGMKYMERLYIITESWEIIQEDEDKQISNSAFVDILRNRKKA